MTTKLWLDDTRPAPEGWVWAKTVEEAIEVMVNNVVSHASLDHDLGVMNVDAWMKARDSGYASAMLIFLDEDPLTSTGRDFCLWMVERNIWPSKSIVVHSANILAAKDMVRIIRFHCPKPMQCIGQANWG